MKKVLIGFGAVFLALIIVGAGLIGFAAYKGSKLDASSKAYVDATIPLIAGTWSKDELTRRMSAPLRESVKDEQLSLLFVKFKQLGRLKEYGGAKGQARISITPQTGKVISANYTAQATFENDMATIKVTLVQEDGEWKIAGFHVDSPVFLK
jgi:hypothetical protein